MPAPGTKIINKYAASCIARFARPKDKLRKTKNWHIEFVAGNRTIREATDFTKRTDAAEFLKKRVSFGYQRIWFRPSTRKRRSIRKPFS